MAVAGSGRVREREADTEFLPQLSVQCRRALVQCKTLVRAACRELAERVQMITPFARYEDLLDELVTFATAQKRFLQAIFACRKVVGAKSVKEVIGDQMASLHSFRRRQRNAGGSGGSGEGVQRDLL
eukprot:gnl/Hemi2/22941_TR7677_c0_g11_i1.p1 gnl/Hemi2/22941_TR7677_c0_g11~~gnl/Hemi2/22941_TR7677_c0_g11_i1.p1  ORF type:complete len:143 (-),score=27.45 gnl/Hemi2/22941_TR7677_c0_g11_i1:243-623(-)